MNKINLQLDRLLRAASQAPTLPRDISFFTEEKIIAAWKSGALQASRLWETELYAPALAVGVLMVSISIALAWLLPGIDGSGDWGQTIVTFQQLSNL